MSINELKSELRENYQRVEDVLTGMDVSISQIQRVIADQNERIEMLEGQLASLIAALQRN
jgi:hypothetical protein